MPISNNTDEKVGVEVSGPTANANGPLGRALLLAGVVTISLGVLTHQPIVVGVGLVLTLVGAGLLWSVQRAARRLARPVALQTRELEQIEFPIVLEPKEELADPDNFSNKIVKFYQITPSDALGEQIATIDFSSDEYRVIYHQNGDPGEIPPQKIIPNPIWIGLSKNALNAYLVNVQPEG